MNKELIAYIIFELSYLCLILYIFCITDNLSFFFLICWVIRVKKPTKALKYENWTSFKPNELNNSMKVIINNLIR